jgi:hypothetical protein
LQVTRGTTVNIDWTLNESASTASLTCTLPSAMAAGKLLTAHVVASTSSPGLPGTGGWQWAAGSPLGTNNEVLTGLAYTTDPAAGLAFTQATAGRMTVILTVYSGGDALTVIDVTPTTNNVITQSMTLTDITTVTDGDMLVSGCGINASTIATITQPSGWTLVARNTSGTGKGGAYADLGQAIHGATGSEIWTNDAVAGTRQAGYLAAIRAAVDVAPPLVFAPPGRIAPNGWWTPFPSITDAVTAADVAAADAPNAIRAAESPATVTFDLLVADSPSAVRLAESPATAGPSTAITDTPAGVRVAESPATTTITMLVADTPSAVRAGPSPATVTFDVRTADTPSGARAAESSATAGSSTFVADTPAGVRVGGSPATVVFDVTTADAPNGVRAAASTAATTITVLVADAPNAVRLSDSFAGAGSSTFASDVASGIRAGSSPASVTFGTVLPDTPAAYRLPATTPVGATTGQARSYDTAETTRLAHQNAATTVGTSTGTAKIG